MHIGVLALQGDFHAHLTQLRHLGASCGEVRSRVQLARADALIIPGGESTTLWRLLEVLELEQPLRAWLAEGKPVFGTCAGAILLAREILGPDRAGLGALDIDVRRNAYGRQIDSFLAPAERTAPGFEGLECLFIRAPVFERIGPQVEVLAEVGGRPVWVREGRAMAATFHPELTHDLRVHRAFLELASAGGSCRSTAETSSRATPYASSSSPATALARSASAGGR
ncbi:MAG: pyridoxal 5'-phosphate synthase glutaminase subunit PdxT [Planctomycetes bacterium]|nr:pyridoxal 5'-phosphate synthase glutaminase subunit PdxT [Planctomycetota bacterium]